MSNETTNTANQVISTAINNTTDNTLNAVFSIIKSYKELQLPAEPKDAYDLGARDAIDTLVIHLNKFAEGLKAARE